jgi:hypothetical protein
MRRANTRHGIYSEESRRQMKAIRKLVREAEQSLARDAMYLLRSDTYVALAATEQKPETLRRYFIEHGLSSHHRPNER